MVPSSGESALRSVLAAPDDDEPRLVYADWLMEQGATELQERGEFIALDCATSRCRPWEAPPNRVRLGELRQRCQPRWVPAHGSFSFPVFRRGFVEKVTMQSFDPDSLDGLFALTPLRELELHPDFTGSGSKHAGTEALLASTYPARLAGLVLWRLSRAALRALAASTELAGLRRLVVERGRLGETLGLALGSLRSLVGLRDLEVAANDLTARVFASLLRGTFPRLERLDLRGNSVGLTGAKAMRRAPGLPQLRALGLGDTRLGDSGVSALLRAELPSLETLDLSENKLTSKAAIALGAATLPALRDLHLDKNPIGDEGAARLPVSHLARLVLRNTGVGDQGVAALLDHVGPALRWLDLSGNGLGPAAAATLARTPVLSSLTHLDLTNSSLGDEGAGALAATASLRALRTLRMMRCGLGPDGVAALAASEALAGVEELDLQLNGFGDAGLEALASSPHLGELGFLNAEYTLATDRGALALAASTRLPRLVTVQLLHNSITEVGARALRARFQHVVVR